MFHVENDNLCDDWAVFPTQKEAEDWVGYWCHELALANVDSKSGLGNVPAFQGMTLQAIEDILYAENVSSIEER